MESSKYYTPELEEFYQGFEYEVKDPLVRDYEKEFACKEDFLGHKISCNLGDYYKIDFGWKKRIYNNFFPPYTGEDLTNKNIQYFLNNGVLEPKLAEVRVKYLDKEDIESLGWVFDKTSDKGQWKFHKNNMCLFYRPKTKELGTFTMDPSKSEYLSKYSIDNKHIRFLIIKNKSELKKLLKQLDINESN